MSDLLDQPKVCSTCGQALDGVRQFKVDLNTNRAVFGSYIIQLTETMAEMLQIFMLQYPKPVTYEKLDYGICAASNRDLSIDNIKVQIYYMNQRLKPAGAKILNIRQCGYQLVYPYDFEIDEMPRRSRDKAREKLLVAEAVLASKWRP